MNAPPKNPLNFQIFDSAAEAPQEQADSAARFAVGDNGRILHANPEFRILAQLEEDSAPEASSIIRLQDETDFSQIESGPHVIYLRNDTIPLVFHFDWVDTSDGTRTLIASEIPQGPPAEEQLQTALGSLEGVEDLRNFLNMTSEVMIVADENANLIRVNKSFHRLFGYNAETFLKLTLMDLFDETERASIRNYLQGITVHDDANIGVVDFEAQGRSEQSKSYWMEWRLQHRGGYIYCVGHNVTATKNHEEELFKREKELMEAEIIGRMGRWRWAVGRDSIEWSDQIFRIFGVARDDFSPSIHSLNSMVHRRDVGRVVQGFQRAIIEQNDYDMEFRVVRPGGDIRYIRCEGRCERDSEGDVIALYGIMQDMTERMLYERELKEAKDSAERAYAAKSQFLANMSHELRTPLNAIIGFSEMMQRQLLGPIGTEKYLDYIAGIRESGEHLLDLISDILDMSKIEAGKHELDLEEINVNKTIKLAVHMMEGRAQECGIKVITDALTNEDLNIIADRRAFMQIILNLLSNAVKFSNDGGHIWLECNERAEFISIKVRDEGIGIPANKLQCILRPFEQASSSYAREHEGSGLGLAITKELVEMHQGTLLLDSVINEGTTVTVRMPYDPNKKLIGN